MKQLNSKKLQLNFSSKRSYTYFAVKKTNTQTDVPDEVFDPRNNDMDV